MIFDNLNTIGGLAMFVIAPIVIVQYYRSRYRFHKTCFLLVVFFKERIRQGHAREGDMMLEKTEELFGSKSYARALKLYDELYYEDVEMLLDESTVPDLEKEKLRDIARVIRK